MTESALLGKMVVWACVYELEVLRLQLMEGARSGTMLYTRWRGLHVILKAVKSYWKM